MLQKVLMPGAVLLAGIVMTSSLSSAKPAYSKTEKKSCVTCHIKNGAKELNDAGKYYQEHKSLKDYKGK